MAFDLVVKNGMIVDGSGLPRYRADIGVKDGKIAEIGRINGAAAKETMDADGRVVSPGFVDGHTHMDAQIFWDPIGTSSCFQGVTTVLMGNCGFTLAPCREAEADLVMRNLERAEDISRAAMKAGIKWRWETFPEFLDVLESLPKGINYAGYMGHCALAHLRDGPARLHRQGDRGRSQGDGASHPRIDRRRRARLLDHAQRQPHDLGRQAGGEPARHLGRVRDAGQGDGRRHGRGRGRTARRCREGAALVRGPCQARHRERPADHLRPVQPARRPGPLAHHLRHHRAHRPAGRPHVRPGPQPGAERAALLRDAAAVRQVGHVARHAQAAAGGAEAVAARRRQAPQAGRDRLQALRGPDRARRGSAAAGVGLRSLRSPT